MFRKKRIILEDRVLNVQERRGTNAPVVLKLLASSTYCFHSFSPTRPLAFLRPGTAFSMIWIHPSFTTTTLYICSSHSIFISVVSLGPHSSTMCLLWLPGLSQVQEPHFCGGFCTCCSFCLEPFHIPYFWKIPNHPSRSSFSDTSSLKPSQNPPWKVKHSLSCAPLHHNLTMHQLLCLPQRQNKAPDVQRAWSRKYTPQIATEWINQS